MKALTSKQEGFVAEYLVDLNATAAASRAGYKDPNIGPQLLQKTPVADTKSGYVDPSLAPQFITKNNVFAGIQEAMNMRSEGGAT